jgi:hypothetical protein
MFLRLPIVGDSAVRLLITLGARSAWLKLPKRLPNGQGAAEAKVAALYPKTVPELTI